MALSRSFIINNGYTSIVGNDQYIYCTDEDDDEIQIDDRFCQCNRCVSKVRNAIECEGFYNGWINKWILKAGLSKFTSKKARRSSYELDRKKGSKRKSRC